METSPSRPILDPDGFTFQQECELAKLYWPTKWASARSKQRRNLRKAAVSKCLYDYYLSLGYRCRTCTHRSGSICDFHSDFYGQVKVKESDLCSAYKPREN